MITNFLIGAIIVAVGWAILAFGRNWFDTMNRNAKKGGCPVNERFMREINIQTLDDLENYIWEEIGSCDMEEVRRIVDLFRKYGYLLEAD